MTETLSPIGAVEQDHTAESEPSKDALNEFIAQLDRDPEVDKIVEIYNQPDKLTLPNPENYSEQLKQILELAEKIKPLTSKINPVSLLTIDNLGATKKSFLANPTENPVFTYQKSTTELKNAIGEDIESAKNTLREARSQLLKIHTENGSVEQVARFALGEIIRDHVAALDLTTGLTNADEEKVKASLEKIYGQKLSETTITNAQKLFEFSKTAPKKTETEGVVAADIKQALSKLPTFTSNEAGVENLRQFREQNPQQAAFYADASELQAAFSWGLEQYYSYYEQKHGQPLPEDKKYQVLIDPSASSIDVRDKAPQGKVVVIPENRVVKFDTLLKLIEHEIEAHARQGLNGSSEKIGGLGGGSLKVNDEVLMEGLALVNEDELDQELFGRNPELNANRMLYIFTEQLASEGKDFVSTFQAAKEKIIELFTAQGKDLEKSKDTIDEKAWLVTYRAFRGHTDTSNSLGFASLKDRAYLEGYLLVKQLQDAGVAHLNEFAIPQVQAVRLLARFDLRPTDQDFPHLGLAKKYYLEKLQPQLDNKSEPAMDN